MSVLQRKISERQALCRELRREVSNRSAPMLACGQGLCIDLLVDIGVGHALQIISLAVGMKLRVGKADDAGCTVMAATGNEWLPIF